MTLTCEDGLPLEIAGARLWIRKLPRKFSRRSGTLRVAIRRIWRSRIQGALTRQALHFGHRCSEASTQSGHDCCAVSLTQPHFPSARAQNSALKTPKSLRPAVKGASLWLRKPNFWSDPKNSELLRIFRNFFWPCTAALSRGRLNQALQLPYIGESPFIYGVGNSR